MADKSQAKIRTQNALVRERVGKLRKRQRAAGLKRVEVMVPVDHVDALKAYALQLREGSQSERLSEVRKLVAKAYESHFAHCLDNISIEPEEADFPDAIIVAAALKSRGGAEAFRLGREIDSLVL